jgi:hypothetical protein
MTARNRKPRVATGKGDGKVAVKAPNLRSRARATPGSRHSPATKGANAAKRQAAVDAAFWRLERAGFKPTVLRAHPNGPSLGRVWTLPQRGRQARRGQGDRGGEAQRLLRGAAGTRGQGERRGPRAGGRGQGAGRVRAGGRGQGAPRLPPARPPQATATCPHRCPSQTFKQVMLVKANNDGKVAGLIAALKPALQALLFGPGFSVYDALFVPMKGDDDSIHQARAGVRGRACRARVVRACVRGCMRACVRVPAHPVLCSPRLRRT